ncbi:NPCBM/NEW2 domain-containing protein [Paludisphaera mucosa]|uniref:NPCBM/NEW2 domain-containing protein n=1 Tax=Paludisphaera mucosa TaxID=3030827 RepID=A0ABT6F8I2_9BACT|nr:NPCBM/NEW2 domain-containing protein [Paludisphaera mucosa]MDG3003703.1 NPCBM/NEW2 domain-containing protein [Paludisphaera mucosa]
MERRALLSGVGVNLEHNYPWDQDEIWTDIGQVMNGWSKVSTLPGWSADPSIPKTTTGYPLAAAVAYATLAKYPDGVYQVSYEGTASVDFSGVGVLAAPMVKGADGVTRGTVIVGAGGITDPSRNLFMSVISTDATNPMSDLHIWAPGYPTDGSQLFTREFLKSVEPFDYIRFMPWEGTNNSTVRTWSQRAVADDFFKSNVPYEQMIELCNETGKDMWITVAALADDDYVRNLADLLHSELNAGLKVHFEYSNETWNQAFLEYSQVLAMARTDTRVTATNDMDRVAQESALQTKRLSDIFRQEYGPDFSRVIPVFGSWAISPTYTRTGLEIVQRLYGDVTQYIKSVAIAPYVSPTPAVANSTTDPAALLASTIQQIDASAGTIRSQVQAAAAYGLPLDAYEGGAHLTTVNNAAVQTATIEDPGMYDAYRRYLSNWTAAGGGNMTLFTLTTDFWGLKPYVGAPGSQRWDAVMSTVLQPGDADLDGDVDFNDFQIVAADMNRVEQWWEQGDFNHDRKVDAADLSALLANLDVGSLTADQAAAIAVALRPATTTATAPVDFQVYDQKNLADFTFTSAVVAGGSYVKNGAFNGSTGVTGLQVGGVTYPRGLGVSSSSTIVVPLQGLYTSFSATIGIDDRAGANVGQATFQLVGDGRVLYTSPVMQTGTALPINVDVTGVSSLSLVVTTPSGASVTIPADWAQARLVDARSTGAPAPTLTWTVTKDGTSISTTTAQSFAFAPTGSGNYVVSVTAVDSQGRSAVSTAAISVGAPTQQSQAAFVQSMISNGNWKGQYGVQGSVIAGDFGQYPPSASVSLTNASTFIWNRSATDFQSLQKTNSTSGRIASAWYASSFTIDVNFAAGESHLTTLYAVDWDGNGRAERIDVVDAATGQVLDTRSISSFRDGVYLTWNVSGHVLFRITSTASSSAVVSGVFFDAALPSPPSGADTTTRGDWIGTYGGSGQLMLNNPSALPSYASVTTSGASAWTWAATTTNVRGLLTPDGSKRQASAWYSSSGFTIDVNLTDGKSHKVSLYAVDWGGPSNIQRIDLIDAATGQVLDSKVVSSYSGGIYLSWNVSGHVLFRVTKTAGVNALISGVFFDDAPANQVYAGKDDATKGDWIGAYGGSGQLMLNNPSALPSYASVATSGAAAYTWAATTTDPRALETADGARRQASTWYSASAFTIDVNLTDGRPHRVSLYAVDWDGSARAQRIEVVDAATGQVLDTRDVASFNGGVYLTWNVSGHVLFRVTRTAGVNAVVSGVFFDDAPAGQVYAGRDAATKGDWIGAYGGTGQLMLNNPSALPSYASVATSGAAAYTWAATTTDPRALETADGARRQASTWYSASAFTIDVNLTDGRPHRVSLYAVDWDGSARAQRIEVVDAATGQVLDTRDVASFNGGVYLTWNVSGHVLFRVTRTAGVNAVVSGVFFDDAPAGQVYAGRDAATKGDWIGAYGGTGQLMLNNPSALPSYASVATSGAAAYTWAATTTDPRALETADGARRQASTWYSASAFTIDVNLTDGRPHRVSLYAVDWDGSARAQRIEVVDAATGQVLDTRDVASFNGGVYLTWNVSGHVLFRVTRTAGVNAVVSGVFID